MRHQKFASHSCQVVFFNSSFACSAVAQTFGICWVVGQCVFPHSFEPIGYDGFRALIFVEVYKRVCNYIFSMKKLANAIGIIENHQHAHQKLVQGTKGTNLLNSTFSDGRLC